MAKVIGGCQALVEAGILDEEGNVLEGGGASVENATTVKAGVVKQMEAITDLSSEPTQSDFNGLLAKMRTAGILAGS